MIRARWFVPIAVRLAGDTAKLDVEIRGKAAAYEAELRKIPGVTGDAARKASAAWDKNARIGLAKEAAGITKAGNDIAKSWTDVGKKLSSIAGGPVAQLGDALFELVPKASAAGLAVGGIAAGAVGVAAVGAAMYGLAEAGQAARDRLTEAGLAAAIPEASKQALDDYAEATKGLRTQVDLLLVSLGTHAAPAVSGFAHAASGAAAEMREAAEAGDGWGVSAKDVADTIIGLSPVLGALTAGLSGFVVKAAESESETRKMADAAWMAEEAYAALGMTVTDEEADEAARTAKRILEERKRLGEAAAKEARKQAEAEAAAARAAMLAWLDSYDEQAAALRATMLADNDAKIEQREQDAQIVADMETQRLEYYASWREQIHETAAAAKAARQEEVEVALATAGSVGQIAQNVTATAIDAIDKRSKAGREAARNAAKAAKSAAIFGVGIDTAAAIVKGFAMFGPPPSPAGIAAAAAALSAGVAQTVAIAKQPLPKFFSGSSRVPGSPGMERGQLHGGEIVMRDDRALVDLVRQLVDTSNRGVAATRALGGRMGGGGGDVFLDGRRVGRVQRRVAGVGPERPVGYTNPFRGA